MGERGFFDIEDRYEALSKAGDPLEKLLSVINFEIFRETLDKALSYSKREKGGRPPCDAVMMFKILVLQGLYNFSDDRTEYLCRDRLSFMRFLGLDFCDKIPDAKTIWLFRERLKEKGAMDKLFHRFNKHLKKKGYLAMGGQMIDASIIQAPRQRMTSNEKETVKAGKIPENWEKHPPKKAQKDRDARWIVQYKKPKKNQDTPIAIPQFGYKDHISIDRKHGLIRNYTVTDASRYEGHEFESALQKDNTCQTVWADTAYSSKDNRKLLKDQNMRADIHTKKPKGKPMNKRALKANGRRSKIRALVEHPFAHMKSHMNLFVRTIGLKRAHIKIGMANLAYNFRRFFWLETTTMA